MKCFVRFTPETNADYLVLNNCENSLRDDIRQCLLDRVDLLFNSLCVQFGFSDSTKEKFKASFVRDKRSRTEKVEDN